MKLSEAEHQHLHDLAVALDRPQKETARLVKLGLAENGQGKFGVWARITKKGREFIAAQPLSDRIRREGATVAALTSNVQHSGKTPDRGGRAASKARPEPQSGLLSHPRPAAETASTPPGESTGRRRRDPTAIGSPSAQGNRGQADRGTSAPEANATTKPPIAAAEKRGAPHTSSRSSPTERPRTRVPPLNPGCAPLATTSPNAVRVSVGNKVTYYPISMFGALNGTKQRVVTSNKFYRPYPLASSAEDQVVL